MSEKHADLAGAKGTRVPRWSQGAPAAGFVGAETVSRRGLRGAHLLALRELVKRDFQGRYAGSLFGFLWSFVQPLWQIALFSFVFSTVLGVRAGGQTGFAVFLFCGLLPWHAMHEGLLRSTTAITDNANLVKKLSFPSEILILSAILAALVHELIAAAVFCVVLTFTGVLDARNLPFLLLAMPLQVALTLGLGLLLASLQVFFRDLAQIAGIVLSAWFYLTPIVYPISYVPERFRPWIEWNPLTALVALYRRALIGEPGPSAAGALGLAATAFLLLALGRWVFARLEPAFVDEI